MLTVLAATGLSQPASFIVVADLSRCQKSVSDSRTTDTSRPVAGNRRARALSLHSKTEFIAGLFIGEIGDTDALPDLRRLTSDSTIPSSGDDVETTESVGEIAGKSIRKIERRRVIE